MASMVIMLSFMLKLLSSTGIAVIFVCFLSNKFSAEAESVFVNDADDVVGFLVFGLGWHFVFCHLWRRVF